MGGLRVAGRWVVNFGLLVLPIAVTLGILFGIQSHRDATGQPPLFTPEPSPKPKNDNGLTTEVHCQKAYGIEPPAKGQKYILNPNQWGWTEGEEGELCVNVTSHNNGSYATNTTAPEFFVTWLYPQGPADLPVHAFPNIMVDGGVFPASLDSLDKINLDLEWTYGIGNGTTVAADTAELEEISLNANVAIDMFLDADKEKSGDSEKAGYEIMVWFATFGPATQPLGLAKGTQATKTIDGTTFNLYVDKNEKGQEVLTWSATEVTETFKGDIAPLVLDLLTMNKDGYPTKTDYLGYLSLGSEALWAKKTVTFHVPELSIDVRSS